MRSFADRVFHLFRADALRLEECLPDPGALTEDAPGSTNGWRNLVPSPMDSDGVWWFTRECACGHVNEYSARAAQCRCLACNRELGG